MEKVINYSEQRRAIIDKYLSKPHSKAPSYQVIIDYIKSEMKDFFESHEEFKGTDISKSTIARDLKELGFKKEGNKWIKEEDTQLELLKSHYEENLIGKFYAYSTSKKFADKMIAFYKKNIPIEGIDSKTLLYIYSITLLLKPDTERATAKLISDAYAHHNKKLAIYPGYGCLKIETPSRNLFTKINRDAKVAKKTRS